MSHTASIWDKLSQLGEKLAAQGGAVADDVEAELGEATQDLEGAIMAWINGLEYNPRPILNALREVKPCVVAGDYAVITRYDDCTAALGNDRVFHTAYGPRMKALTEGANNILGMQPTPEYTYRKAVTWLAFRRDDAETLVRPIVERHARAIVGEASGRLDVVPNLFRQIPLEIVRHYFGVPIPADRDAGFAADTETMSKYIFNQLKDDPEVAQAAQAAAGRLSEAIQHGLEAAEANPPKSYDACTTVLERIAVLRRAGLGDLPDKTVRAMLLGLIVGFVPNTIIAAGNSLNQLLDRPDALQGAQAAARTDDRQSLFAHWFEALRFNNILPGPFRTTSQAYRVPGGGVGGLYDVTIPAGKTVLVATQAAMFDGNRVADPDSFRLDRPRWQYLIYGHGTHSCMGTALANMQVPTTLGYLLARDGLRRAPGEAGQLQTDGPFPAHLTLEWQS